MSKSTTTTAPKKKLRWRFTPQPPIPDGYQRLFYFTTKEFGLQSVRDQRLKVSRFTDLNDPFDFLGIALKSSEDRIDFTKTRGRLNDQVGLICMARDWTEPLLWGHYADKHKGICLQFLVPIDGWQEVKYITERPTLATFGKSQITDLNENDYNDLSLYKFKQWEYEQESRLFVQLVNPDMVSDFYFHPFSDARNPLVLERIILGARCDVTQATINKLVKHNGPETQLIKARPAHLSFKVIEDTSYKGRVR